MAKATGRDLGQKFPVELLFLVKGSAANDLMEESAVEGEHLAET